MQSVRFTPEHVEQVEGDAVGSRNEALARLQHVLGVGPPDLMWVRKTVLNSRGAPVQDEDLHTTFYHWVVGQEVSSAASVAAYFAELCEGVERPSFIQGFMWSSQEYKVVGGTYCCFDAFSRLDLRCNFAVPGGVTVDVHDANGDSIPATDDIWIGACVSGFLRSQLLDRRTLHHHGGVKHIEIVTSLEAEEQLLACVEHVYRTEELRQRLGNLEPDPGQGVRAEDMDVLCATLYHYFRRRQRLEQACDFFSQLVDIHVEAAMYAAMAEHELDLFEEAMKTLEGAVKACPGSVPLKVALGQRLLEAGHITRAVSLAREALKAAPQARCAWLLLSNAYTAGDEYSLALIAANLTPPPPSFPNPKTVLGAVPPPVFETTKPQATQYDPEIEEIECVQTEAELDGNDELLDLPAAALLPLEPMSSGRHLNIEQHRAATCVYAAVYDILVDIVDAVGWDNFLEERGATFLMSHEIGSSSAAEESLSDSEDGDRSNSSSASDSGSDDGAPDREDGAPQASPITADTTGADGATATWASAGQRTPPPAGHRPAAAPPPSSGPGPSSDPELDLPAIVAAGEHAMLEAGGSQEAAGGVNPHLWSLVYGGGTQQQSVTEGVAASVRQLSIEPSGVGSSSRHYNGAGGGAGDDGEQSEAAYSSSEGSGSLEEHREQMQSADMQWMIEGDAAKLMGHKRLCEVWVDELLQAVYKDLSEYMNWILLDRRIRRAGQRYADPHIYGEEADSDPEEDEAFEDIPVPVLVQADWMRRGLLCWRLQKLPDAERAFRVAVGDGFNMTAYQALASLYTSQGLVQEATGAMVEILFHHVEKQQKATKQNGLPGSVVCLLSTLVMMAGLQETQQAWKQTAAVGGRIPEAITSKLFQDIVYWQVDGFDS